ncbi:MAG TPA: hypothetical protein VLZ06_04585 [Solirubrobacteraceae bacterium]|nr:hypothetical protein [Solirubrobacteraceae bacterium]
MRRREDINETRYRALQAGALEWSPANTTERRAQLFLAACGFPAVAASGAGAERAIGGHT